MEKKVAFKHDFPNPNALQCDVNFFIHSYPHLELAIHAIHGVDQVYFSPLHKYEFSVFKGQLFDMDSIKAAITNIIKELPEEVDKP